MSPTQFGDNQPHLVIYHEDGGHFGPFNDGFIGYDGSPYAPGSPVVGDGRIVSYGVQRSGTDWWFYYSGYWIGRLPREAFHYYYNTGFTLVQSGGEVSSTLSGTPCTQMGNGIWGSNGGALSQYTYYGNADTGGPSSWLNGSYTGEGVAYNIGYQDPITGSFRYGGPGFC